MFDRNICHALGLHMHQPPGNLKLLIETNRWEAEQIIRCYERAARFARLFRDVAVLHVGFSGILLEQLRDPRIIDAYRRIVDIPRMLADYREADNIELVGMGYFHPVFPLIPEEDWRDQLQAGRQIMEDLFGRLPRGFWPPEMAFSMNLIPALVKAGYAYVVVDGVHVRPEDGVDDIYRPYQACHAGVCITVVPRDRTISNAQESGLDPSWFVGESKARVAASPRPAEPRLVTTWSDGENGGWFRQTHEDSGFFGHFFAPYMELVRSGDFPVAPVSISQYLERQPATMHAQVQAGAWNVGATSGYDFSQWSGTEAQCQAVDSVRRASARQRRLQAQADSLPAALRDDLEHARRLVLEGETSCFLFWGDDWIPHLYERIDPAERIMDRLEGELPGPGDAQSGDAHNAVPGQAAPPRDPSK
jgi:alpha-amylase/alpha-mannosidase (GH57 family)